jgi:hypothetical protein
MKSEVEIGGELMFSARDVKVSASSMAGKLGTMSAPVWRKNHMFGKTELDWIAERIG